MKRNSISLKNGILLVYWILIIGTIGLLIGKFYQQQATLSGNTYSDISYSQYETCESKALTYLGIDSADFDRGIIDDLGGSSGINGIINYSIEGDQYSSTVYCIVNMDKNGEIDVIIDQNTQDEIDIEQEENNNEVPEGFSDNDEGINDLGEELEQKIKHSDSLLDGNLIE